MYFDLICSIIIFNSFKVDYFTFFFLIALAGIAFCYSAVGHGGASGYIAMFALFGMVSPNMKSFVLVMNLAVASISFFQYYKQGYFNIKYFFPFGLGATPMAYLGASIKIDASIYQYILSAFLLFSVLFLLGIFDHYKNRLQISYKPFKALLIAMLLEFVSGITGVGGGIFLSPILLMLGWLNVKQTAAVSALFIVLNSLAGLVAIQNFDMLSNAEMLIKLIVVASFGYLGSKWGVSLKNTLILRRMLAFVLLIAAIKLCFV